MRKYQYFLVSFLLSFSAVAGRTPGFSMTAFNTAVPNGAENAVFSPFAFELDCAAISEAFGPIEKAKYVETLGALVGYENIYRPLRQHYLASVTNGFELVSARAFLTPSLRLVSTKYRSYVQQEYGVHACPVKPFPDGAESFLRTAMDGLMEGFSLPREIVDSKRVSFVDLESFSCPWSEPFSRADTRKMPFAAVDGSRSDLEFISGVRNVGLYEGDRYSMVRIPMANGVFFFAVLPPKGATVGSVRGDFASDRLGTSLVILRSITEKGVYNGPVEIALPKFSVDSSVDLLPAFRAAEFPIGGFKDIFLGEEGSLDNIVQRVRFSVDENGCGVTSATREAAVSGSAAKKFICDRPFLFFVYHEPTQTIPVAGIFAGVKK